MGVSEKDIDLLPGWRKPLRGGINHLVILMSQYSSGVTTLGSTISGAESTVSIEPLTAYYTPSFSGFNEISGVYRAVNHGEYDLSGIIQGLETQNLLSFYRGSISGTHDLTGFILPIEPASLTGTLIGVLEQELEAEIESIDPVDLSAIVSGITYKSLTGNIYGVEQDDLYATYSGYASLGLYAEYWGTGSGIEDLNATLTIFKGIEEESNLQAAISGIMKDSRDLSAKLIGHTPASISGFIYAVPPVDLPGFIHALPSGVNLDASIEGVLPPGALMASINSRGGFSRLAGMLRSSPGQKTSLMSFIQGVGEDTLYAEINSFPMLQLNASINYPEGAPPSIDLRGKVIPTYVASLSGSYTPSVGNNINAQIDAIEPAYLKATIKPRVFFIESSLLVNTIPFHQLKATINSDSCDFSSYFADLRVSISGINKDDLSAQIYSIEGELARAYDEIELLIKNKVVSQDWIPLIINQPGIIQDELDIILTSESFLDLRASITALPNHSDLAAEVKPKFYSNVLRDNKSIVEWVNTSTGERKTVRVYFRGDAINYYYSDLANDTFSFSPDDYLEIEVESYDKLSELEENSLLTIKTDVKRCTVDRLTEFTTIDEAIRYGIMCAVSEISQELRATITARGGVNPLKAEITPLSPYEIHDLRAKYFPSSNDPVLSGSIDASGGFAELDGFIRGSRAKYTEGSFTDTFGQKYVPKLIVHGDGTMSIVLTKVYSTDKLQVESPDLHGEIVGICRDDLDAVISGSL